MIMMQRQMIMGFRNPDSVAVNVQAQSDDYGLGATFNFESSEDITCTLAWMCRKMARNGFEEE